MKRIFAKGITPDFAHAAQSKLSHSVKRRGPKFEKQRRGPDREGADGSYGRNETVCGRREEATGRISRREHDVGEADALVPCGLRGRYVTVSKPMGDKNDLVLCEVEVFAEAEAGERDL